MRAKLFRLRFFLRKIIHYKNYKKLTRLLAQNKDLEKKFQQNPKYFNDMLCKKYGSLAFSFSTSFIDFENDLKLISLHYPNILKENQILFATDEIKLYLNSHPRVISEGIFDIKLFYKDAVLYSLSFISHENALLITAIQGELNNKEAIKEFTKSYHGLRPINFIIYFAFIFAKKLGLKSLNGIKDKYLISGFKRNRKRGSRTYIIPNYDEIWCENTEIIKTHKSFYELDLSFKDIEQIPSKKRSMYKKRYEFLKSVQL